VLKHVEKEWGGIEPTPFAYKHVENERGGVEPTMFVSKCMENERGEVELTPFGSKCALYNKLSTSGVGVAKQAHPIEAPDIAQVIDK